MAQHSVPPPVLMIEFEIERRPRVLIVAASEEEQDRVLDWIGSHDEYATILERALELAEQEPAA